MDVLLLTLIIVVVILITLILFVLYQKCTNAKCKSKKRLDGKVTLVTGGTSGMGLDIATDFAHRGAKVIIACPFEEEGTRARQAIIEATGHEKVIFKLLDLASLDSVKIFASEILNEENRLDILINNAGVGLPNNPKTYNGTNFIMHVNYVGHFLLTNLLLPLLKKTGTQSEPSRIVNTGSVLHLLGSLDLESKNKQNTIYRFMCYCNSKYCCILFTHVLSKKLNTTNVVVNTVDPGVVGGTGIISRLWWGSFCSFLGKTMFKASWDGAQTALHVALDEKAGQLSGKFYQNCKLSRPKRSARDDNLGNKLWDISVKIVNLKNEDVKVSLENEQQLN